MICQIATKIWWVGGTKMIDGLRDFAHAKCSASLLHTIKISGQRRMARGIDMHGELAM